VASSKATIKGRGSKMIEDVRRGGRDEEGDYVPEKVKPRRRKAAA